MTPLLATISEGHDDLSDVLLLIAFLVATIALLADLLIARRTMLGPIGLLVTGALIALGLFVL